MENLGRYVVSVTAAAMISGIATGLVKQESMKALVRLLCGLMLTVTVLYPISGLDFDELLPAFSEYGMDGELAAASGKKIAMTAMADIIKAESEAYILDKAAQRDLHLEVMVTVGGEPLPVPEAVRISGNVSPYDRKQLSHAIETDLGIAKENQLWTG